MTGYLRPDGLEMVPIAPHQWVNARDGVRLGLVARQTPAAPAAEPVVAKRQRKAKLPAPEPVAVIEPAPPDPLAGLRRYATILFGLGNSLADVIKASGLTREVAIECRKAAART